MYCAKLIKQFKLPRIRQLHSTFVKNGDKSTPEISKTTQPSQPAETEYKENVMGSPRHIVSNFDKRILVWVKRFPSMDQVPRAVSIECIQRAHTKARIRVCFILMGISIVGFIASIMSGKRDVASGKNMLTERMKWHEEIKEKGRRERENAEKV